jgi:hypothetical protein
MEGYGTGQVCAQCHKARPDNASVLSQIETGTSRPGPHHSNQTDMFLGAGSYEIPGYTYNRNHAHKAIIGDACVTCHMTREVFLHGEEQEHAFHTFSPDVGNCTDCHAGITDFDVNGVQTEIHAKLDQASQLLGYADLADFLANWNADNTSKTVWEREVGYAILFVDYSGDFGTHNPAYARSLLDNAIDYANLNLGP